MKKFKLALIFVSVVFALAGCGEKSGETPETNDPGQNAGVQEEKNILISQPISEKIAGYTEVVSYVGDCDGDGADETVVLSTAAERDSKGEFFWNDGQNWALYVKDSADVSYILYDGYVQTGSVYFDVADYYMTDGAKPVITVTVSTGAGLTIKNYSFSKPDSGYVETNIYNTQTIAEGGINRRFSSVPEIIK